MASDSLLAFLRALHHQERTFSLRSFDAARIRDFVAKGLGPLLYLASRDNGEGGEARALLRGADLSARVLIGHLTDATMEILAAIQNLDAPVVLLKGISICEEYYPEPHCRTMGDIDFLVPQDAYAEVEKRIIGLGYERRSHRETGDWSDHHHGDPLFHPDRGVWVEIHTGLFPQSAQVSQDPVFSVSIVMGEARPSSFFQHPVHRLSPEIQLIYIASHWAYDLSRHLGRHGVIVPLVDVIYLLEAAGESLDWERVLRWSAGTLAGSYLFLMLTYLSRRDLITVPAEILKSLGKGQQILKGPQLALLHWIVERHLLNQSPRGGFMSERSRVIVWQTLLRGGSPWLNLASVPWNLLFPPGDNGRFRLHHRWTRMMTRMSLKAPQ